MLHEKSLQSRMDTQVSRSKEQVSADLEGDSVILNVKSGKYYSLNPVGARVWKLIESPVSLKAIHAALLDEFDVDSDRCRNDLLQLIEKLSEAGLIQISGEVQEAG